MATKQFFLYSYASLILLIFAGISLAADETSARTAYFDAERAVTELQSQGLPTLPLRDMLELANQAYKNTDYNLSQALSENVTKTSQEIIALQKKLLSLTDELSLVSSYGYDANDLEFQLLYAKSDFEAANIELAKKEAETISSILFSLELNYSKMFYAELEEYQNNLSLSEESGYLNITEVFIDGYFSRQRSFYQERDYAGFLKGYSDFENIKKIILAQEELSTNIALLGQKGIKFSRLDDSLEIFGLNLEENDYSEALSTIENLNNISKTALALESEMKQLSLDYEKLKEEGILDNKSIQLYNSVFREFALENYEGAKKNLDETQKSFLQIETNNILFGAVSKATLKKSFKDFIFKNWAFILLFLASAAILFTPAKNYSLLLYSKKSISSLNIEKQAIEDLQKSLQSQYYVEHAIDKKAYNDEFKHHEERKISIAAKIALLESRRDDYISYFEKLNRLKGRLVQRTLKIKKSNSK